MEKALWLAHEVEVLAQLYLTTLAITDPVPVPVSYTHLGFNHGFRFKRGRGAVEIDARILKCGKLGAQLRGIKNVHGTPRLDEPIVTQNSL